MEIKKPNSRRTLDLTLRHIGRSDEDYIRLRTLLANAIASSMMPDGAVKGGSAMKIRFGESGTRASTDLDAARASDLNIFVRKFRDALAEGWNGFTGRLVSRTPAHPRDVPEAYVMQPFDLKLQYLGSSWCTVPLELGHNEIGDADHPDYVEPADANLILGQLGFPKLSPVPTIPLHHQIAQKLHGVSEPGSQRAHDLIDLQLIIALGDVDYSLTRQACERLFKYRGMQTWPPMIAKNNGWDELYAAQLISRSVLQTADEAVEWANTLIGKISQS